MIKGLNSELDVSTVRRKLSTSSSLSEKDITVTESMKGKDFRLEATQLMTIYFRNLFRPQLNLLVPLRPSESAKCQEQKI